MAILTLTSDNKLKLQCSFLEKELAKKISGAYYNREDQSWLYSFSKDRVESFRKYFENIEISAEVLEAEREAVSEEEELIKLKNCKDIAERKNDFYPVKNVELFPHQKVGIEYLLSAESAMLADEMGMGKTLISLVVSLIHRNNKEISKAIVICPATGKFTTWAKQIEKYTSAKYIVIDGSKKEREKQYAEFFEKKDCFFMIVNYETLHGDLEYIKNIPSESIGIADESVYIKNKDAKRTKVIRSLKFKYRIAITGYPAANTILDLHSQFDFVRPGFLGSFWSYCDKYINAKEFKLGEERSAQRKKKKCLNCGRWSKESNYSEAYTCKCAEPKWEEQFFKKVIGYKNLDELKKKIEPFYIRRLKRDFLNLPEKILEEREVSLSGKLLDAYDEMREKMRVTIIDMNEEEIEAKANTILTQMLRLSQLTCGFITDKNLKNPVFFKENPKTDSLDDIVDEVLSSDNKIVIWTRFRPFTFYLLKHYIEGFKIDKEFRQYKCCHLYGGINAKQKDDEISKFQNDPEYKIMISTVQTGGTSIDLFAANTEVFTDLSLLSPYTVSQATDRLHRMGQKKTVVIINQIARRTVDERWIKLLEKKGETSNFIFENDLPKNLTKNELLELLE